MRLRHWLLLALVPAAVLSALLVADVPRSPSPAAAAELHAACRSTRAMKECDALLEGVRHHPSSFRNERGLRSLLEARCRTGRDESCAAWVTAVAAGLDGEADVAAAVEAATEVCGLLGGSCPPGPATSEHLARLQCLSFGDHCRIAGIEPASARTLRRKGEGCDGWGVTVGSALLRARGLGFEVLDLATGEFLTHGPPAFRSNLVRAAMAPGTDGPIGVVQAIFEPLEHAESPVAVVAWGTGLAGVPLVSEAGFAVPPFAVDATNRQAWTGLTRTRPHAAYLGIQPVRQVGRFDLVTGRPLGPPLDVPDVFAVDTSADGARLAVGGSEGALLIDTSTGTRTTIPTTLNVRRLDLSPDGRRIVLWSGEVLPDLLPGTLELWDVRAEPRRLWTAPSEEAVFTLDGSRLALVQSLGSGRVARLADVETGAWTSPPVPWAHGLVPTEQGAFVGGACTVLGPVPKTTPRPVWVDTLGPLSVWEAQLPEAR